MIQALDAHAQHEAFLHALGLMLPEISKTAQHPLRTMGLGAMKGANENPRLH
jgi:hypothetical protein